MQKTSDKELIAEFKHILRSLEENHHITENVRQCDKQSDLFGNIYVYVFSGRLSKIIKLVYMKKEGMVSTVPQHNF